MKRYSLFLALILLGCTSALKAQTSDQRFAIGINWQWEDFNATHIKFPDNVNFDHWQGYKFPSAIWAGMTINPSFNLFGQFGVSELSKSLMVPLGQPLSDYKFWTGDINFAYKFANGYMLKESSWFDPYIYLGLGGSNIYDLGTKKYNYLKQVSGIGLNIWLTRSIGINAQAAYDNILAPKLNGETRDSYLHYSSGLKFRIGSRDMDEDGVKDRLDKCPQVPGKIKFAGCPDSDNDGIVDSEDECPTIPGKSKFNGCPDTDGDGIADKNDACPTQYGTAQLKGCPDKDNDGVTDKEDACPDVAGLRETAGCPDRDNDGIADIKDPCPDKAGSAENHGCPDLDSDGDGVIDRLDQCPTVSGEISNNGCPVKTENLVSEGSTSTEYTTEYPAESYSKTVAGGGDWIDIYKVVYFGVDKSVVITRYTKDLNEVADLMKQYTGVTISVEGHADATGNEEYNMRLSEKRADYVINYLAKHGVSAERMYKSFAGETNPVGDNSTAAGRALNRRVEIKSTR